MADDEAEDEGPVVELGDGPAVEGAPIARITSRLHYGVEKSEVVRREGDTEIRTSDGPRTLESILDDVDETYFPRQQDLADAVRGVIGYGPVQTEQRDEEDEEADAEAASNEEAEAASNEEDEADLDEEAETDEEETADAAEDGADEDDEE